MTGTADALLSRLASGADALAARAADPAGPVPAGDALSAEERREGFATLLPLGLAALREDRDPAPGELDRVRALGAARARAGRSLDATLAAYRSGATLVFEEAGAAADTLGVPAEVVLGLTRRFWAWLDAVIAAAAEGHRAERALLDAHDGAERAELLRRLLAGTVAPAELPGVAAALGLAPDARVVVCRARPADAVDAHRVRGALAAAAGPGVVRDDVLAGEVTGVLARRPPAVPGATVGVGGPAALGAVAEAAADAATALRTALALGLEGTHAVADLGLLPLVVEADAVGERVVARCLAPLTAEARATTEATLRALLAHDLHVDETARALAVHPNTLRYRMRRFTEATGLDLGRLDDVVLVWWALRRRDAAPAPPVRPDALAPAGRAADGSGTPIAAGGAER